MQRKDNSLRKHDLDPSKMRGQAYDGAGNMSSKTNGAAACILPISSCSLRSLCFPLNLAVVSSLEEVRVCNMIGVVNQVLLFFSQTTEKAQRGNRKYTASLLFLSLRICAVHSGLRG